MSTTSPCLTCGACCATFRVSFYWGELQSAGGLVPDGLTEKVNLHQCAMQGTNQSLPRCTALMGSVGEQVRCTIYENRPSPCREFTCAEENDSDASRCNSARARFGLPPLVVPIEFFPDDDQPPAQIA